MTEINVVRNARHDLEFDVRNLSPKTAVALNAACEYDVETMRFSLVNVGPQTNTAMDPKQWSTYIAPIPLDSRLIDEFAKVSECNQCDANGKCCGATLTLSVTNESSTGSLNVYTDSIVHSDPRVQPVHRTFFVQSFQHDQASGGILVVTTDENTFSDGELVSIVEADIELPAFARVEKCLDLTRFILKPLFADEEFAPFDDLSVSGVGEHVGLISNRQLLYVLGPKQSISWSARATKGTGRDWVKWSPCFSYYRPLFRDNMINRGMELGTTPEQRQGLMDSCPKSVFDIEDGHVVIARPDDCDACRQCTGWADENGLTGIVQLSKKKKPEWQRFRIKSTGSLDSIDIVTRATEILMQRLNDVARAAGAQLVYPTLPPGRK